MTDGGGLHAGAPDVWRVRGNAPDPATVGVEEGIVKYDLMVAHSMLPDEQLATEGVMLVQLTDPGTLRIETFPGMLPHEVHGFTAAARSYVR